MDPTMLAMLAGSALGGKGTNVKVQSSNEVKSNIQFNPTISVSSPGATLSPYTPSEPVQTSSTAQDQSGRGAPSGSLGLPSIPKVDSPDLEKGVGPDRDKLLMVGAMGLLLVLVLLRTKKKK